MSERVLTNTGGKDKCMKIDIHSLNNYVSSTYSGKSLKARPAQ